MFGLVKTDPVSDWTFVMVLLTFVCIRVGWFIVRRDKERFNLNKNLLDLKLNPSITTTELTV